MKITLKNGSYFQANYDNILKQEYPSPLVFDWKGQYNRLRTKDFSSVSFKFAWRFGDFKEKSFKGVDDSRFGRN